MKLTIDEFMCVADSDLIDWYNNSEKTIKIIINRLEDNLRGYQMQTGLNRLAFYSIRKKTQESFLEKIRRIRKNRKNLVELFNKNERLPIQEIIKDIIGARLVMYFQSELGIATHYFNSYPKFTVEDAIIYDNNIIISPLKQKYKSFAVNKLKDKNNATTPSKHKESSYESIHLIIRYKEPFASIRNPTNRTPEEMKKIVQSLDNAIQKKSPLTQFPIEIQIRTILQHTWAQINHRMIYNLQKSEKYWYYENQLFLEDFHCHKVLLDGADHHQNIILERFHNFAKNSPPFSKEGTIDVGPFDLKYFSPDEFQQIIALNKSLDTFRVDYLFNSIDDLVEKLTKKYKQDFLSLTTEETIDKWSRKKIILSILGYLLFKPNEQIRKAVQHRLSIKPDISIGTSEVNAITLYEFIRLIDTYFRLHPRTSEDDKILMSDPLIYYRLAGAYLRNTDYRRCISLLDEAIKSKYVVKYQTTSSNQHILNEMHFLRRIGEYYHFACLRDGGGNKSDLESAISYMLKAYESYGPENNQLYDIELRKVISNIIVYTFLSLCQQTQDQLLYVDLDEFSHKINNIKNIKNNVKKLFCESELIKNKSIHAIEAMALYMLIEGKMEDGINLIEQAADFVVNRKDNMLFEMVTIKIREVMNYSIEYFSIVTKKELLSECEI